MRLELLDDRVEQVADAVAVLGADLDDVIEAEPVELERAGAGAAIVGLVDGENDRHVRLARGLGDFLVAGHKTFAAVDDEHDQIGRTAARGRPRSTTSSCSGSSLAPNKPPVSVSSK